MDENIADFCPIKVRASRPNVFSVLKPPNQSTGVSELRNILRLIASEARKLRNVWWGSLHLQPNLPKKSPQKRAC